MCGLGQRTGSDSEHKQLRVQTAGGKPERLQRGFNPLRTSWRRRDKDVRLLADKRASCDKENRDDSLERQQQRTQGFSLFSLSHSKQAIKISVEKEMAASNLPTVCAHKIALD